MDFANAIGVSCLAQFLKKLLDIDLQQQDIDSFGKCDLSGHNKSNSHVLKNIWKARIMLL